MCEKNRFTRKIRKNVRLITQHIYLVPRFLEFRSVFQRGPNVEWDVESYITDRY